MNILPLRQLYKFELGLMMYKLSKNVLPSPLKVLYTPNSDIHNYNTRQRNDAHIRPRRTEFISRTFIHRGPELWLAIPEQFKVMNKGAFKSKLKVWLAAVS